MSILNPPPTRIPARLRADTEVLGFLSELLRSVYLMFNRLNGVNISSGTATPESAVVGRVGDLFLRTDGGASTVLYVKESGADTNTGWIAK